MQLQHSTTMGRCLSTLAGAQYDEKTANVEETAQVLAVNVTSSKESEEKIEEVWAFAWFHHVMD